MAKTEYTINFNYKESISQADALDKVATKLKSDAVDELEMIISIITKNWEGQNADAYLIKCKREKTKIENTIKDIKSAAAAIRRIAETVKATELRALALAKAAENKKS